MTAAEACAGLTPAQVDAIPRVREWLCRSRVTVDELRAWIEEYEALKVIFGGEVPNG